MDYKEFAEEAKKVINESSLSRLYKHNELHDCGALTAFRKAEECGDGRAYSKAENMARNKSLLAKLKFMGYGATTLFGVYPEGGVSQKEVSYFVVDLKDKGKLKEDLAQLGEEFEQDSVLIIPKGSILGEAKAYLLGTNRCDNNWLGYGKTMEFEKGKMGYESPIYTSFVNGRPFIFEEVGTDVQSPGNGFGFWTLSTIANKRWEELV